MENLPNEANLTRIERGVGGEPRSNPNYNLFLPVVVRTRDGREHRIRALVDTGAEVALVRRGLFDQYLREGRELVRLEAANQQSLGGNHRELVGRVVLTGADQDSQK